MKTALMWIGALAVGLAIAAGVVFAVVYFMICGHAPHGGC